MQINSSTFKFTQTKWNILKGQREEDWAALRWENRSDEGHPGNTRGFVIYFSLGLGGSPLCLLVYVKQINITMIRKQ